MKKIALLLFLLPHLMYAQTYARADFSLQNAQGQAISGAQVYILTQPANTQTLTPLATIYGTADGSGGPINNPLTTDGFGHTFAYTEAGVYTVVYVSPYTGTLVYPDQNFFLGGNNGIAASAQYQVPCYASGGVTIQGGCGVHTASDGSLTANGFHGNADSATTATHAQNLPSDLATQSAASPNSATFSSENKIYKAETFSGATADIKIAACLNAIPNGGTCDARGFGQTTQTIAAAVTVGAGSKFQTLLLDPGTVYQPTSASTNMFVVNRNGKLYGSHIVFPSSMTYSGCAISVNDNVRDGTNLIIKESTIDASQESNAGVSAGSGVCLSASNLSTQSIAFATVSDLRCIGLLNCINITTSGSGFVNGNSFINDMASFSAHGVNMNAAGGAIDGNQFTNYGYQNSTGQTINGVVGAGSGGVTHNLFYDSVIWDTTVASGSTPIDFSNANAQGNVFFGRFDGIALDNGTNVFYNALQGPGFGPSPLSSLQILSGTTAPLRRGITLAPDSGGDITLWVNSQQSNPNFFFKDGNTGNTLAEITSLGTVIASGAVQLGTGGPTWTKGAGAPSGACTTGSFYSNTSGTTGATFYVCESGAWVAK